MSLTYDEAGRERAGVFARVFRRFRWFWVLRRWHQTSRRWHRIFGHEWRVTANPSYCPCGQPGVLFVTEKSPLPKPVIRVPSCMCWAWLDENRVAQGYTAVRFPDDSIPGRFHYVDCPLGLALALSDSRRASLTVKKLTATRPDE